MVVAAGLAAVWVAAGWRQLVDARSRIDGARSILAGLVAQPSLLETPEGRRAAREGIDAALAEIDAADRHVQRSWALRAAAVIPGLSRQREGLVELVADARTAVKAGRLLLTKADAVATTKRVRNGTVPLEGLRILQDETDRAADVVAGLERSSAGLWWGLGEARRNFDRLAGATAARLRASADALAAARTFFGEAGPRRYLVAIQNNAEMRDQGIVLSYAVLEADTGRVRLVRHGRITELGLREAVPVAVPPGTAHVFGFIEPTLLWQSVNATADFPWSARVMAAMFAQATGTPADGVIAIDVPGLAALLRVLGPVQVEGIGEPIDAGNVARILLHDLYAQVPVTGQAARYERLADVTAAVFDRLVAADLDAVAFGRTLADAAAAGHLRLWSAHPAEQRTFLQTGIGAGPAAARPDRTFHVAVENRTAAKLDYYVGVAVRQKVRLTRLGTALVTTTVTVDNRAPVGAAPSYQLGPDGYFTRRPGEYWAWVLLWGPRGATQPGAVAESGLLVREAVRKVEAGERASVRFSTIIPNAVAEGALVLRWVPQPRLSPIDLEVTVEADGWHLEGEPVWRGPLDRVRTLRFPVRQP